TMEDVTIIPPVFEVVTDTLIDLMDTSEHSDAITRSPPRDVTNSAVYDDLVNITWPIIVPSSFTSCDTTNVTPMVIDDTIQLVASIDLSNKTQRDETETNNTTSEEIVDDPIFPSPSPPKNPFLPDPYCLAYDKLNVEHLTEIGKDGRLFTKKALK